MKLVKAYKDGVEYLFDEYWEWEPGANTLLYLPLDTENQYNNLGTGGGLSTSGYYAPVFGVYQGVDCANFGTKNSLLTTNNNQNISNYHTMSLWVYARSNTGYGDLISSSRYFLRINTTSVEMGVVTSSSGASSTISTSFQTGKWIYLVGVKNYNSYRLSAFIDGIENKVTYSGYGFSVREPITLNGNLNIKGYMSNVIVENKARTDEKILEYYNGTKSKYGL